MNICGTESVSAAPAYGFLGVRLSHGVPVGQPNQPVIQSTTSAAAASASAASASAAIVADHQPLLTPLSHDNTIGPGTATVPSAYSSHFPAASYGDEMIMTQQHNQNHQNQQQQQPQQHQYHPYHQYQYQQQYQYQYQQQNQQNQQNQNQNYSNNHPNVDVDDSSVNVQYISCCLCGLSIPANPAGRCGNCLKLDVEDATAGIERSSVLLFCKYCNRYQKPPWIHCEWESKELLALCLKRLRGLQHQQKQAQQQWESKSGGRSYAAGSSPARLVNACFLYTEPHSQRVKVKLTMQKELYLSSSVVIEQDMVVEYVIQHSQCDECKRAFTPHIWTAVVQIRQRTEHKRTLMYLEQIILKNQMHEKSLRVVEASDGYDFQFAIKNEAQRFSQFVISVVSSRFVSLSKQMVSHDAKSNVAFNKHTISIEVCPISKDDLIFLPHKIACGVYGGVSPFLLCSKITTSIQLIDPFTRRVLDIPNEKYWRFPFESILYRRHLSEYIVLDVELVDAKVAVGQKRSSVRQRNGSAREVEMEDSGDVAFDDFTKPTESKTPTSRGRRFNTPCLADVEVARASDLGCNDIRVIVRTHLGGELNTGDYVLGYDLRKLNLSGLDEDSGIHDKIIYDVILVRKTRKLAAATHKRNWVLQRLPLQAKDGSSSSSSGVKGRSSSSGNNAAEKMDLEELKTDLEEDVHMRQNVNLWKDPRAASNNDEQMKTMVDDQEKESIQLCELLDGLTIEDNGVAYIYE